MQRILRPDIVVTSPDGDYLMIVEVKVSDVGHQGAIDQIKHYMASLNCSTGLVVSGERIVLLRDSLEQFNGKSIYVVGEANLPASLLPSPSAQWKSSPESELASQVQQWLESLNQPANFKNLPDDLRELMKEPVLLLQLGEVRAASPRWSRVAS
jgi:hypothetical protein